MFMYGGTAHSPPPNLIFNQPDIKTGRYEAFTRKWSLLLYQEQGRVLICSRCGCGRTKPCEADTHTHTHKVECWPLVAMAA